MPEWPRGERLEAIRDAAIEFRKRFKQGGEVLGVRTIDLAFAGYPTRYAFGGAAKGAVNPYVSLINRMVVVQFEDFSGEQKTLVWEPTVPEGVAEAPFYEQLSERFGDWLSTHVFSGIYHSVDEALSLCGLTPADVDYASFDHLHVQDPRFVLGTTKPVDNEAAPREPLLPNATFISQRKEVATLHSTHPMQWAWYVPDGLEAAREDNHLLIDGDVELGKGVAIVATPGHTDGNHSLCLNTPEGIWVSSENGVSSDNWQPELSKIPGVKREAEFFRREVILNSNTLEDSIDQYDSMVKEKCLADANARDPRWLNILPSSEIAPWRRQWPILPTHTHGGIEYGQIRKPSQNGTRAG